MLISRIFDGFSDVVMGYVVSKDKIKMGTVQAVDFMDGCSVCAGAILLFTVPHTSETLQFIYMFVTYNFCTTICYTAINLPYGSLSAMMTRNSKERDLLSVFRMGMSPLGRILAVSLTMPLVKLFGDNQIAWVKCMGIWAALAFVLLLFCFVRCEETVQIKALNRQKKIPLKENLKALGKINIFGQYYCCGLSRNNSDLVGSILPYYLL